MVRNIRLVKGEQAVALSREAGKSCSTSLNQLASPQRIVNAVLCHFNTPSFIITGTIDGPIWVWIMHSGQSDTVYHLEYWPETSPSRIYLFTNANPYWSVIQLQRCLGIRSYGLSVIKGGL
ncbi:hypothetical protein MFMK1_000400 [Metallumcola ferriviriculae]|uniref:Uncharacterized protein n=1 Tax=Metallumcola ferriviriculae TaxID=3039180 RepID=A0AAU0UK70_9FIRM|nr:hypothetical protein MFMK1_000400 [Desulfitibacteraceae bacterium MK1]